MPHLLIGWARVLEGQLHDARVGRDVLIGIVFGSALALILFLANGLPTWLPFEGQTTLPPRALIHGGSLSMLGSLGVATTDALANALGLFSLYFLLRAVLRHNALAAVGVGLIAFLTSLGGENPWLEVPGAAAGAVLVALCTVRYGLLAAVAMWLSYEIFSELPLTLDFSRWYAAMSVPGLLLLLGLLLYAFRISLGGKPVFAGTALDD
jgi:hypothetical protein